MGFTVVIHHRGRFVDKPRITYEGGDVMAFHGLDLDRWSYFELLSLVKELGYDDIVDMWWKIPGLTLENGLRKIKLDCDALELGMLAESKKCEVDVYVEHVVSQPYIVKDLVCVDNSEGKAQDVCEAQGGREGATTESEAQGVGEGKAQGGAEGGAEGAAESEAESAIDKNQGNVANVGSNCETDVVKNNGNGLNSSADKEHGLRNSDNGVGKDNEVDSESETDESYVAIESESDESDVDFEPIDSEEERDLELDDGLGEERDKRKQKKQKTKFAERAGSSGHRADGRGCEVDDSMHVIDDAYSSDELYSGVESDSDGENIPKYTKYKMDLMCKEFEFKIGMEFSSLEQFKEAIMEHSVLNGKEVKFQKNDAVRCRVVCKNKCGFLVLVSKCGGTHTFRVKTLVPQHTCGRVFDNKNANSKWVAKVMVDKLRNNSKVTIRDIIGEIRGSYSTRITKWRALRAKQIASGIVEGEATKQYSLLWSYSAELRRANEGNTCKIQLERLAQNLQPRFGRFYMCLDGCKRGFLASCRPFIGVDGCHLKTQYGGQLLVAVGRDPNDQYFPLAFAVVETECKDSWRWFLSLLLDDIGDISTNRWVFISDQQKVMWSLNFWLNYAFYYSSHCVNVVNFCFAGSDTNI